MTSTIRAYLEETRAREGDKGWLRREPKATHPEILEAVRAFRAAGGSYDDEAERYVEEIAGDMPEHRHHGDDDRHELTKQLGHECYIAKGILSDERAQAVIDEATAAGFRPLATVEIEDGKRYTVRCGTQYVGQDVPSYGRPTAVRGKMAPDGHVGFVLKGARNFVHVPTPALLREGWE